MEEGERGRQSRGETGKNLKTGGLPSVGIIISLLDGSASPPSFLAVTYTL